MAISGLQRAPTTLHLTTFADLEASEGCRPRGFVIAWGGMRGSEHDRVRCVTLVVSRNFSRFEQAVGKRSERTTQS